MQSYPKVWALGHKAVEGILQHDVVVQEKVDGSQMTVTPLGPKGGACLETRG
ncbi:MAG: hypothetical protein KatS3mg109_0409 [Pirellulaceae bacterium]|nr:MAG: hypothetical protein KatS3mg109_0409 [Pirellulaceae bacterium]